MSFETFKLQLGRGRSNRYATNVQLTTHTYKQETDTLAQISTASYFPDNLGASTEFVQINDLLEARGSDGLETYEITSLTPLALTVSSPLEQTTTAPITWANAFDPISGGTLNLYRSGSIVHAWIPAFSESVTTIDTIIGADLVPVGWRPTENRDEIIRVNNNNVGIAANMTIFTSGTIEVDGDADNGAFNMGPAAIASTMVCWVS